MALSSWGGSWQSWAMNSETPSYYRQRFFRKLLKGQGCVPRQLITDKLRSYAAAHAQ